MSETVEITQGQSIRLRLLSLVGYDTAAAAKAIEFVNDDPFNADLFEKQYNRFAMDYPYFFSRSLKAIQEQRGDNPV